MEGPAGKGLEDRILDVLRRAGRPLEFSELREALGWEGDARPLRKALARLERGGLVERVPDYDARRMKFRIAGGGGSV